MYEKRQEFYDEIKKDTDNREPLTLYGEGIVAYKHLLSQLALLFIILSICTLPMVGIYAENGVN
jgi:hypothetical protein